MTDEAVATKKGQTTIPIQLRKYRIIEGSKLQVIDNGNGVLKPKLSLFDLAGSGSKKATVKEMKELLENLREEDA